MGVNQSTPQEGNYVGFANFRNNIVEGTGNGGPQADRRLARRRAGPVVSIELDNEIECGNANPLGDGNPVSSPTAKPTLDATMVLTFQNSGVNGQINLGQSVGQPPLDTETGPILFNVGFGASTGPVHFTLGGTGAGGAAGPIPSTVTVVGQTPVGNDPPSPLTRNTATDFVQGPISQFKIIENVSNTLPPTDGTPGTNPYTANQFANTPPGPPAQAPNYLTHNLRASAPGAVCLVLDNGQGNDLHLGIGDNGWSVSPNAGTSGFSGTTGSPISVEDGNGLFLPVTSSSNTPATWTTNGLFAERHGVCRRPGVHVGVLDQRHLQRQRHHHAADAQDCPSTRLIIARQRARPTRWATCSSRRSPSWRTRCSVRTRRRPPLRRSTTSSTSAKGDCVSNTVGPSFFFGPSIFLARSELAADALGGVRGGHSGLGCAA